MDQGTKKRKSKRSNRSRKSRDDKQRSRQDNKSRQKAAAASRASATMSLTDLQMMAKSRGIPFGGLNKTKLVRKINNY